MQIKNELAAKTFGQKSISAFAIGADYKFRVANHHKIIVDALHNVSRGTIKRLIITVPPRHGKTTIASEYFPAWYLGNNPDKNVILTSYGDTLATNIGRKVRNICESDYYRLVFDGIGVSDDSSSKSLFHLSTGGGFLAVGRGGAITGFGGDLIVIDDIFKNRQDASSAVTRENVISWYKSTLRTRLAPQGAIVIVNTRWHEDDLVGHLLKNQDEKEPWHHINMPAINAQNEALWPDQFSLDDLLQIKKDIGSFEFEALYQQNPTPLEGAIIKRKDIQFYKLAPECDYYIQSWDMTFKDSTNSDYVVGQVWGLKGANFYLIDQLRSRLDFAATKQAFKTFSSKHPKALKKLVEDKANGPAIISDLKSSMMGIEPIEPYGSKQSRLISVSPLFEAQNVFIPDPTLAPWVHDYIEELVGFPTMKHDDQVDATSMALSHLKNFSTNYLKKLLTL